MRTGILNVNWVKPNLPHQTDTESFVLDEFFVRLWNCGYKEVYIHDPEVSRELADGYLRVLDDSLDAVWDEFFEHSTPDEYHRIARKKQKDCTTLLIVREAYPPYHDWYTPFYLLLKEG